MTVAADEVLAIGEWRTNAELIASAHRLGYVVGSVIDLTYGEKGGFWKRFRPDGLVTNDLRHPADFHRDFRRTGFEAQAFDTVVFDPPYKLAGRRDDGGQSHGTTMDQRYGVDGDYVPVAGVRELLIDGTTEACRIARRFVLVKCMDQVSSGRIRWQTDDVRDAALAAGFLKKDVLMLRRRRAQIERTRTLPDGSKVPSPQMHARRNYSTLLVFEAPKKRGN